MIAQTDELPADMQTIFDKWQPTLDPSPETSERIKTHLMERIAAPGTIFIDHSETCYRCGGQGWIVKPAIRCAICRGTGIRQWQEARP